MSLSETQAAVRDVVRDVLAREAVTWDDLASAGLLASLVWIPEDFMRFYFQYSHAFVTGGPFADEVSGLSSSDPDVDNVDYGVDFFGTRAQIDF